MLRHSIPFETLPSFAFRRIQETLSRFDTLSERREKERSFKYIFIYLFSTPKADNAVSLLWCYMGWWAAVISYHQVNLTPG